MAKASSDPDSNLVERNSTRWKAIELLGALKVAVPLTGTIRLHSRDCRSRSISISRVVS